MYRPKQIAELRTPVQLLTPEIQRYNGVETTEYPESGEVVFVNWKTYGGTQSNVNGVISIVDTAEITTWYRPDITAKCRLLREDGKVYQIISEPENCDLGNQYLVFKVERVKGRG